ncbi:hypothetical protein D3C71_2032540 [compost metagenome]
MCSRNEAWGERSGGSLAKIAITMAGTATLTAAKPYTACHPNFCASIGASSAATAVPTLPAPTMPMARPL